MTEVRQGVHADRDFDAFALHLELNVANWEY